MMSTSDSSEARSKRLRVSHDENEEEFGSPSNGPRGINADMRSGHTTPNSYFPLDDPIPTPTQPRTPSPFTGNFRQLLLASPRKSLKRNQMSPLLLPRIHTEDEENDEDVMFCYDERYEDQLDVLSTQRSKRAFGTVWFDSESRKSVLKPRLSRLAAAKRTTGGRTREQLIDVAIELALPEGVQDFDCHFPLVVLHTNAAGVENHNPHQHQNAAPARSVIGSEIKSPSPRKATANW